MLEFHYCLPDGRWHLSGGQAYRERWRFKGVEEVGEPQNAWRKGECFYTTWKWVELRAVRVVFDISTRLTLGFELVGFEAESDCEKRLTAFCQSIGNLLFGV